MKKIISFILLLIFSFGLAACVNSGGLDNGSDQNPTPEDSKENVKKAFVAQDSNGKILLETDNLWNAIIAARDASKSSNKCVVLDASGQQVFKWTAGYYHYYREDKYYGSTKNQDEAINWAKKYDDSYVIDGKGIDMIYVGKSVEGGKNYQSLNKDNVDGIENYSASYGYIYSTPNNYTYIEFTLEFSKAKYSYFTETSNENGYNAYLFANYRCINPWNSVDLGMMQIWEANKGMWQACINYNGNMYAPKNLNGGDNVLTQMTYNEKTGYYEGADDLHFKCYYFQNSYYMYVTNLTTNEEFFFKHSDTNSLATSQDSGRVLLAASYCPVQKVGSFWNPYCGNEFSNIIFRDVNIAKKHDVTEAGATNTEKFYKTESNFHYALTMGADNCKVTCGDDYWKIDIKNYKN